MQSINYTAAAIFLGCGLVALAIMHSGMPFFGAAEIDLSINRSDNQLVYGSKDAAITIVEFSDFECPFCARVHPTIERVVDESDGAVNWEYRHLPLSFHALAWPAAIAAECVAEQQGNEAFWQFSETLFTHQSQLSNDYIAATANTFGVTTADLVACAEDATIIETIETDMAVAKAYGGNGTPFSVIVYADGTTKPVSGALPYEHWQSLIAN